MKSSLFLIPALLSSAIARPTASPLAYTSAQDGGNAETSKVQRGETERDWLAVTGISTLMALSGIGAHLLTKDHYKQKIKAMEAPTPNPSTQPPPSSPANQYPQKARPVSFEPLNADIARQFQEIDRETEALRAAELESADDNESRAGKVMRLLTYCAETRRAIETAFPRAGPRATFEQLIEQCKQEYGIRDLEWFILTDVFISNELKMRNTARKNALNSLAERAAQEAGNDGETGGTTDPTNNNAMDLLSSPAFASALKRVFPNEVKQIDQARQRNLQFSRITANGASIGGDGARVKKSNGKNPNQLLQMSVAGRKLDLPSSLNVDKKQVNQWTQQAKDEVNHFFKTMQNPASYAGAWTSLKSIRGQTVPKLGGVPAVL
ncbi:MAG: hypothetical protein M1823_003594 [Watsoniomyces obsoletus]|nr:MAG: hypothetical protein M1823_003594 [Watsoniomyces obsoletus]